MKKILCLAAAASFVLVACSKGGGAGDRVMIQNKGSDTMVNLAQAWAEDYRTQRPNVAIAVSGGGSGTGIASLMNGTVDIANSSRELKKEEQETAKKNTGKEPVEHAVAYDALAIYVHASNPMTTVTKEQLACIFAENGKCTTWKDIGVEVKDCPGQEIVRVGRQNNSGTYQYFREWAIGDKADFKLGSRDMQGSKDVVDLVEHTPCAIGYSGIGYKTAKLKALCVSNTDPASCVEPSAANTLAQTYPISRLLYMYTLGEGTPEVIRYLDWVRSDAGQALVERSGYVPLPADKRRPAPAS